MQNTFLNITVAITNEVEESTHANDIKEWKSGTQIQPITATELTSSSSVA